MITLATRVHLALKAANVAAISVSIGDDTNKATWTVAPPELQSAAQPIIDAFVMPTAAQVLDEDAQRDINDKKLQAVALALWECIPNPLLTKAQLKTRAIALYKSLP